MRVLHTVLGNCAILSRVISNCAHRDTDRRHRVQESLVFIVKMEHPRQFGSRNIVVELHTVSIVHQHYRHSQFPRSNQFTFHVHLHRHQQLTLMSKRSFCFITNLLVITAILTPNSSREITNYKPETRSWRNTLNRERCCLNIIEIDHSHPAKSPSWLAVPSGCNSPLEPILRSYSFVSQLNNLTISAERP